LHEQPQPPGGKPLSVNSAHKCRKLLALILSDAVTADLVTRNAARIPRRRGMAASEARTAAAEAEQEPWTDPLQALLIAERATLLSGRDEEFVELITMHYTGMRWGEVTGLEASNVKPGSIRIWWQLAEVNGRNASHRAQACWLPILPSATPHSYRHGRETCMDGHGVQKVLRDLVMGHRTAGMECVYAHARVTDGANRRGRGGLELFARRAGRDQPNLADRGPRRSADPIPGRPTMIIPTWFPVGPQSVRKTVGTAGFEPATP
jgi:hypothetical protein